MQKLKDLLENIHEWQAKCEIVNVFFHANFLLYSIADCFIRKY